MQIVRLKTPLSEEEMLIKAREREPEFRAQPGLLQKYYVNLGVEGEFGGVYIWDSMDSLKKFRETQLAKTIAQAYQALEPPSIEVIEIMFQLRDQAAV